MFRIMTSEYRKREEERHRKLYEWLKFKPCTVTGVWPFEKKWYPKSDLGCLLYDTCIWKEGNEKYCRDRFLTAEPLTNPPPLRADHEVEGPLPQVRQRALADTASS